MGYPLVPVKTEFLTEKQPSQELVTPKQIGALLAFLCFEAAQIRGVALPPDGG
jgi:3-hydroxybutyrate dehydrogenase